MKKIFSLVVMAALTVSCLGGCGKAYDDNVVNISILSSKPEIFVALDNVIKEFEEENEDIRIKSVKYSQASSYREKLSSMNARDNAPTLSLVDSAHIKEFDDICLDLSSENWINEVAGEVPDIAKNEKGEVVAFPFSTEGTGFIYNKKVIDQAGIDVEKIRTINDLEEAFQKVNAIGKGALIITNEEWSLGDHFFGTFYGADIKHKGIDNKTYFENLKRDIDTIGENEVLNGLIDTFDIMKKYNIYSDNPLAPSYDKCSEMLGSGEVGFWYMGNWASQNVITAGSGNKEFGFVPVPVSNNASEPGNKSISVGITKYFIVNKNSSDKQIEAAKKFLDYLVFNEQGNKFITEECKIIPAFKNISIPDEDPLVNEILKYRNEDNTIELINGYLPPNNSKYLGGALRKYLNNDISREQLIEEIKNFWINS